MKKTMKNASIEDTGIFLFLGVPIERSEFTNLDLTWSGMAKLGMAWLGWPGMAGPDVSACR